MNVIIIRANYIIFNKKKKGLVELEKKFSIALILQILLGKCRDFIGIVKRITLNEEDLSSEHFAFLKIEFQEVSYFAYSTQLINVYFSV